MENNNQLDVILDVIYRHSMLLSAMSEGLGHAMKLSLNSRPKCKDPDCDRSGTWILVKDSSFYACDRHRAISILKEEHQEQDWDETDDGDSIRKIEEFMEIKEKADSIFTLH